MALQMTKQGPWYDHYMVSTLVKIKMLAIYIYIYMLSNCLTDAVLLNETYFVDLISYNHFNNIVLCRVCFQFIKPCFQFRKSL